MINGGRSKSRNKPPFLKSTDNRVTWGKEVYYANLEELIQNIIAIPDK